MAVLAGAARPTVADLGAGATEAAAGFLAAGLFAAEVVPAGAFAAGAFAAAFFATGFFATGFLEAGAFAAGVDEADGFEAGRFAAARFAAGFEDAAEPAASVADGPELPDPTPSGEDDDAGFVAARPAPAGFAEAGVFAPPGRAADAWNSKPTLPSGWRTRNALKRRRVREDTKPSSRSVRPSASSFAIWVRSTGCCRITLPERKSQLRPAPRDFSQT